CAGQGTDPSLTTSGNTADRIVASALEGNTYKEIHYTNCGIHSISFDANRAFKAVYNECGPATTPGGFHSGAIIAGKTVEGTYTLGKWNSTTDTTKLTLKYTYIGSEDADVFQITVRSLNGREGQTLFMTDDSGQQQSLVLNTGGDSGGQQNGEVKCHGTV